MAKKAEASGLEFTVVILPQEFQLRQKETKWRAPQNILVNSFRENGIQYLDLYPEFANGADKSTELFLAKDGMHLSLLGHTIVSRSVERWISKEASDTDPIERAVPMREEHGIISR